MRDVAEMYLKYSDCADGSGCANRAASPSGEGRLRGSAVRFPQRSQCSCRLSASPVPPRATPNSSSSAPALLAGNLFTEAQGSRPGFMANKLYFPGNFQMDILRISMKSGIIH